MSAGSQSSRSRDIPPFRRVAIHDPAQMPHDYSTTPGGTLFSTTPGGTRIIYDRKFLLQCRTSPLARTPPSLPDIPGVTSPLKAGCANASKTNRPEQTADSTDHRAATEDESQFEMDI